MSKIKHFKLDDKIHYLKMKIMCTKIKKHDLYLHECTFKLQKYYNTIIIIKSLKISN